MINKLYTYIINDRILYPSLTLEFSCSIFIYLSTPTVCASHPCVLTGYTPSTIYSGIIYPVPGSIYSGPRTDRPGTTTSTSRVGKHHNPDRTVHVTPTGG